MMTNSRRQGWASVVGSVNGPSPRREATSEMRRKPSFRFEGSASVQRLAVVPDRNRGDNEREGGDRPQLRHDLGGAVAFQQNAANDPQSMRHREHLADP